MIFNLLFKKIYIFFAKNSKTLGRILGILAARAGFNRPDFRLVQVPIQVSNFGPWGRVLGGPWAGPGFRHNHIFVY